MCLMHPATSKTLGHQLPTLALTRSQSFLLVKRCGRKMTIAVDAPPPKKKTINKQITNGLKVSKK